MKMKEKTIHVWKKIFSIAFCILLTYAFLRVGSPLENNMQIINLLISFITILIIILNIKHKKEIKITKMELCILMIILTSFIPILFNTQRSFNDTIDNIFKYISLFNIFIIVKYLIEIDKKYVNYLINTIIITSIILTIFGIDMMHGNFFQGVYNFLDKIVAIDASLSRMDSLFEYSNTFSMFLGIALILTLGKIRSNRNNENNTNKKRFIFCCLYFVVACFQFYGIIMSGSRMSLILLFFILIMWFLLEKKEYLNKKNILVFSIFIFIATIFLILCFTIESDLILFNKTNQGVIKYVKELNHIKPNTEYNFKFDILCYNYTDKKDKFEIIVRELNGNYHENSQNLIALDSFEGKKNIKITTKQDTSSIRITFESRDNIEGKTYFQVKNVSVNDKKIKMKYFLLPLNLVDRITDINTNSVTDRCRMIVDGLKLATNNLFTGFGTNGWSYEYKSITDYTHSATQMHCYILDVFIQNGILGLISVIVLYIIVIYKVIRMIIEKKCEYYPIILAIILGLLRSMLDFDMNFYSILMLMFILFAITDREIKENEITIKKNNLIIHIILLITMIIVLSFNIRSYVAYQIDKYENLQEITVDNWKETLKQSNIKLMLEPYNYNYMREKLQANIIAKKTDINQKDYLHYCEENIDLLNKMTTKEKGRELTKNYFNLISNIIDSIDKNNVTASLNKINSIEDSFKKDITDKTNLISLYENIQKKLETVNEYLQNNAITKEYNHLGEEVLRIKLKSIMESEENK